jgi:hypothetical protein
MNERHDGSVLVEAPNRDPDGIDDRPTCPMCGKPTRLSKLTPCQDRGKELQVFTCSDCDVRVHWTVDEFGTRLPRMPVKKRANLDERRSVIAWTTTSVILSSSIALESAVSASGPSTRPGTAPASVLRCSC